MLDLDDIRAVVSDVSYKGWEFKIDADILENGDFRPWLQVLFWGHDNENRVAGDLLIPGRKWFLSPYMTESEVVGTAFKAVLTAEEHEAREKFKWRGRSVFGPHIDVESLWEVADALSYRD